jgi:uncharacterized LabA/DUF88 family protein
LSDTTAINVTEYPKGFGRWARECYFGSTFAFLGDAILKANVYIDGFNLYFCALKGTSYKWLNPLALCNNLFPDKTIYKVKYFSAKVKALPHDRSAPTRQDTYWRALKTLTDLEIIKGNFVSWPKLMPQCPLAYINNNTSNPPQKVQVERAEEKGSDVNLAAYLVYDNFTKEADESIVISNDSDLVQAIELVTSKLKRIVIVVNPNRTSRLRRDVKHCSIQKELQRVATRCVLSINDRVLANSQFSPTMADLQGTFSKPTTWYPLSN